MRKKIKALEEAAKFNKRHFGELGKKVGCYYCCNIYPSENILEWCDKGQTAICPICGIDSVLAHTLIDVMTIKEGYLTDREFLKAMHAYWFCSDEEDKISCGLLQTA